MYVAVYRYRPRAGAEGQLVALQQRVAALFHGAGCRRSLLLRPQVEGNDWLDLDFFDSESHAAAVEARVAAEVEPLYQQFLELVDGATPAELAAEGFVVAVDSATLLAG